MGYFPDDFGEMTWRYGLVGDPADVTFAFGFTTSAAITEANMKTAAQEIWAAWKANVHTTGADTITVPWELRGYHIAFRIGGVEFLDDAEDLVVGTTAGDSPVVNTTWLVKKRTGLAGRKNHGRAFVPMMNEVDIDIATDGTVDATARNTFQTQLDDFLTDVAATTGELVLLHALINGGLNPTPPPKYLYTIPTDDPVPLTALVIESKVATQRRRLR